jgi:lambda family phage portal protein
VNVIPRWLRRAPKRTPLSGEIARPSSAQGALARVAPGWAARREESRTRIEVAKTQRGAAEAVRRQLQLVGYRDARPSRMDPTIFSRGASPDWSLELGFDRREQVDRAQQLERDNGIAQTILDRAVEQVVGEGFRFKAKTKDEGWNRAAEQLWDEWCLTCESTGMLSFAEVLQLTYRSWLRDGDVAWILEADGKLRMVESNEIASPQGGHTRPSDADGVELDARGRISAFYVFDWDPNILWPDRRRAIPRLVRVPATDVVFLARRQRLRQTRGISAFNGVQWMLEQAEDSFEAVAMAHQMAACVGVLLQKKNAFTGIQQLQDGNGTNRPGINWEPGMMLRVDPDEDAVQIKPEHPTGTFEILIHSLFRTVGARFGVSLALLNYDFSDANYSNMRAESLELARAAHIKQATVVRRAATHAWGWRLARAIRERDLSPRADAFAHVFRAPVKAWADPEVELRAAMGACDAGMGTRAAALATRGLDFDEVIEELAEEAEKMRRLGLDPARSSLTRDAVPTTKTISKSLDPPTPSKQRFHRITAVNGNGHR